MAKNKKKNLTKNQALWEKEYQLLKRRAKTWQSKHRMLFDDFPTKPEKIYEKDIQALRNIRYKKFTEEQIESYLQNYEDAYETGEILDIRKDKKPYEPPTQNDFETGNNTVDNEVWEDVDNEPVSSIAAIDAWIDDLMNAILDTSRIDIPNYEVREILENLLRNLKLQIGEREFYEYMSSGDVVSELTEIAYEGMSTSPLKGERGADAPGARNAIDKFTRVLNRHRPLTDKQSQDLSELIETGGYEGQVNFDAFEDEL